MNFNFFTTLKKGVIGFVTGLAAVVVLSVVQALSSYNPVICSKEIVDNCTPQFIYTAYMGIIPVVTGALVGVANWLKNRNK